MICDIIDIPLRTPSQKDRIYFANTTASPASSSDSSFESKQIPNLQIPRPLLSQDEKFEASLCSFDFKLLMPDEGSLFNQKLLTQELFEMRFILDQDQRQIYQKLQPFYYSLEICEENILSDDRTTLMLKNIPKYMRPSDLRNLLDKDFKSQFDFLYLPSDNNKEGNLGYAFVNFLYPETVLQFFKKYNTVGLLNSLSIPLADTHFQQVKINYKYIKSNLKLIIIINGVQMIKQTKIFIIKANLPIEVCKITREKRSHELNR